MLNPSFEVKGWGNAIGTNNHINCLWTVRQINGQISRTQRMCEVSVQWNLLLCFNETKHVI